MTLGTRVGTRSALVSPEDPSVLLKGTPRPDSVPGQGSWVSRVFGGRVRDTFGDDLGLGCPGAVEVER